MNMDRRTLWAVLAVLGVTVLVALAAAAPAAATTGTMYITTDTTLTEDHQGQIVINADNVTLDCGGYSVEGTGTYGIAAIGRSHVTIRHCRVSGFGTGIGLERTTYGLVTGNTSTDNINTGIGAYSCGESIFSNNVVSRNGLGFYVTPTGQPGQPSAHNSLLGNTATDNRLDGIALIDPQDSELVGNTATGNQLSGFDIWTWKSGILSNRIAGNVSKGNGSMGFWLTGTPSINALSNEVVENVSTGNGRVGFYLDSASHATLFANESTGNVVGFTLYRSSVDTLSHNVATDNSGGGFVLNMSSDSTLTHNVANNNAVGFNVLPSSTGNNLMQNVANTNDTVGFLIYPGAIANILTRSVAHANGDFDAYDMNGAGANTWTNNNLGSTSPADLG